VWHPFIKWQTRLNCFAVLYLWPVFIFGLHPKLFIYNCFAVDGMRNPLFHEWELAYYKKGGVLLKFVFYP